MKITIENQLIHKKLRDIEKRKPLSFYTKKLNKKNKEIIEKIKNEGIHKENKRLTEKLLNTQVNKKMPIESFDCS